MNVSEAINKVTNLASAQVGYKEGENNWNKYAEELDPMKLTYGNKQNLPWCGEFVLWVFVKCFGAADGLKVLCSQKPTGIPLCSEGAEYFKKAKRFFGEPEVGDIAFFLYDGGINHTGIVTSVSGGVITTIEGNSSDAVSRNHYSFGHPVIAGYGRPNWSVVAGSEATEPVSTNTVIRITAEFPLLMRGDNGEAVRLLQTVLPFHGSKYKCGVWGADGEFGPDTQRALERFQKDKKIVVTSVCDEATWQKLFAI